VPCPADVRNTTNKWVEQSTLFGLLPKRFNDSKTLCRENAKTNRQSKNTRQLHANPCRLGIGRIAPQAVQRKLERQEKALKASKIHTFNRKMGLSRINTAGKFPYHLNPKDRSADFHSPSPSRKI
jgi:hypothetical protein